MNSALNNDTTVSVNGCTSKKKKIGKYLRTLFKKKKSSAHSKIRTDFEDITRKT